MRDFAKLVHEDIDAFNVDIVPLTNATKSFDGFTVESIDVVHGTIKPCVGYILTKDDVTLGYSGDSGDCPELRRIYDKSDYIITEATGIENKGNAHIGLRTIDPIAKENPEKLFYIVHRGDYETEPTNNLFFPADGEIIEISK